MAKKLIKDMTKVGRRVRAQRGKTNSPLWRRKALVLWSFIVRRNGVCEVCGRKAEEVTLNAHHVLPKERYQRYQFAPINGVCLCPKCHKVDRMSAHLNPLWFVEWLKNNRPTTFEWCMDRLHADGAHIAPDYKEAHDVLFANMEKRGLAVKFAAMKAARAERSKKQRKSKKNHADG